MKITGIIIGGLLLFLACAGGAAAGESAKKAYGTAALMVVVEREDGRVAVFDSVNHELIGRVAGLGNLRHASIVFSRDARFAFVAARDGTISKVDLLGMEVAAQKKAGESSIGIAISRDNRFIMVCNYEPGGAVIMDAASLEIIKEIPAEFTLPDGGKARARTVGPLDTADNLMIFALMEGNAVWVVDMRKDGFPVIGRFEDIGDTPYDQLITPDGRHYMVGLLNSDWMGLLDTWKLDEMKRIDVRERRSAIKKEGEKVPLHHIPHIESWAIAGKLAFVPAFAEKRVIVYETDNWTVVKSIPVSGTPLFVVARPGGREIWVDNVGEPGSPEERLVEVIDVERLLVKKAIDAGKGAIHPQFTPKGEAVYISVQGEDRISVYDADTYGLIKDFPAKRPSGIFSSDRASKFGL